MIPRYRTSRIRNTIGIALCIVIGAGALTSAPPSIAQANAAMPKTFSSNFQQLELRTIVKVMADTAGTNIVISDEVPKYQTSSLHCERTMPRGETYWRISRVVREPSSLSTARG